MGRPPSRPAPCRPWQAAALLVACASLACASAPPGLAGPPLDPSDRERALVQAINEVRGAHGLRPLALDRRLTRAARFHSEDMAKRDYFAHRGAAQSSYDERIRGAGYASLKRGGETLAAGYERVTDIVAGWLESPGHRRVLLEPSLEHVGVGHAFSPDSTYQHYWTADFGSLLKAPVARGAGGDPDDHRR